MDETRFDHLTKLLTQISAQLGTRRGLLAFLAALPLTGGLLALLDEEAEAKDRRRRRKRRHKRRTGNHKKRRKGKRKKKKCKPESAAQTCAGQCGSVTNNCQKSVDCGSCACTPACPACQTCQGGLTTAGQCIPNGAVDGQACGGPGQSCQGGACRCAEAACLAAGGCCAGAVCVATDLQSDPAHCGDCQTACAAGAACVGGTCCDGLLPTDDLQAAIDAALDQGETSLTLCAGTWTLTTTVTIAGDLTLRGAGAGQTILDGGDAVRVLTIAAGAAVSLQDLTITRGSVSAGFFPDDSGGGISNAGDLRLLGVAVTGCSASGSGSAGGGGIFNASGGTVTLQAGSVIGGDTPEDANASVSGGGTGTFGSLILQAGSRVAGNSATDAGGGIYQGGGTVTLQDGSVVAGNDGGGFGGGIYVADGTTTLETGSVIGGDDPADANSANFGGGINISAFGTALVKAGGRIVGNTAGTGGGGIYNGGLSSGVTLEAGALVCDNSAPQCAGGSVTGTCPFPGESCAP